MQADEFDNFRVRYSKMGASEIAAFYMLLHKDHPNQDYFSKEMVLEFFKQVESRLVLELGGSEGALASCVLEQNPKIKSWLNWEIYDWPNEVTDSRYQLKVLKEAFAWDMPLPEFDTLVFSHVLEHISKSNMERLPFGRARWIYIDYPERPNEGWTGTCAHVNEMDIVGIKRFMKDRRFELFYEKATGVENSAAMGYRK